MKPDVFIRAYNDVLNALSQSNPSRLFWATDLASKNRFSSPLPDMLEQLAASQALTRPANVRLKRICGVFYHAFKIYGRIRRARRCLKRLQPGRSYTVLKTFVYDHSFPQPGQYKDAFWGQFVDHLSAQGDVVIYAQVLGDYDSCLDRAEALAIPLVPIEAFLNIQDLLEAVRQILFVPVHVPKRLSFDKYDITRLVQDTWARTFKGVQLGQFVQFWAARRLAQHISIDKFYMTYENYPWERMTIMALREVSPSTVIIGYQHTVVPQSFLNYFVSKAEQEKKLLPDAMYTPGERTRDIMCRYSQIEHLPVKAACALRFEYLSRINTSPRRPLKNVLLALEGSWVVENMVRDVLSQMAGHADYQLRVRTHPLLPWPRIEEKIGIKAADFANMDISQGPLAEDLHWADAVIYYSTTVSLEALMMGKPVLHYRMDKILSFDPLFECPHLKKTAKASEEILPALKQIAAMPDHEFAKEQAQAQVYVQDYFHLVTDESLSMLTSYKISSAKNQ